MQVASDTGGTLTYLSVLEMAPPEEMVPQPDTTVSAQPSYVYL